MCARTSTAIGLLLFPLACADRAETCRTGSDAACVSRDAVLLQLSKASLDKYGSGRAASMKLPLCDQMLVDDMCRNWNGGEGTSATSNVTADVLRGHMSATMSSMESALSALGFHSTDEAISCEALCGSVIQYIDQDPGATLPPWSDVACTTIEDETTCEVDVSPFSLVEKLATADVAGHPDDGSLSAMELHASVNGTSAESPPKLVQYKVSASNPNRLLRSFAEVANGGLQAKAVDSNDDGDLLLSLDVWEIVERIANAFRIYPSRKEVSQQVALLQSLEGDSVMKKAVAQQVASYEAQARAWISVILSEMASSRTGQFRRKWFGGGGSKSEAQVRERVQYTMNFVRRVLAAGAIYIYPAEQVANSGCGAGATAYVWKSGGTVQANGAEVNQGPVCRNQNDAYSQACALDGSGRYFIFLCNGWGQSSESYKIETLIHEAVHHSGPSDIQYDRNAMQSLSQADQLGNAANYQNFAQEIAQSVYGCGDDPTQACTYYKNQGYCAGAGRLENVRQACRLTCGLCSYGR